MLALSTDYDIHCIHLHEKTAAEKKGIHHQSDSSDEDSTMMVVADCDCACGFAMVAAGCHGRKKKK
jgi:hypothetical protein